MEDPFSRMQRDKQNLFFRTFKKDRINQNLAMYELIRFIIYKVTSLSHPSRVFNVTESLLKTSIRST